MVVQHYCGNHPKPEEPAYPLWQGLPRESTLKSTDLDARMRDCLGIGVPAGTGCSVLAVTYGGPTLVPQIKQDFSTGTYCVRISDVDGLPQAATFTIRVIHP